MAGSALGAQIRREVFGELENLPRLPPKTRYLGDLFALGAQIRRRFSQTGKNLHDYPQEPVTSLIQFRP